jgi:hypothetical protein
MGKLGFAERWIKLVMTCIHSVSYSVVINGNPIGHIHLQGGYDKGTRFPVIFSFFVLKP